MSNFQKSQNRNYNEKSPYNNTYDNFNMSDTKNMNKTNNSILSDINLVNQLNFKSFSNKFKITEDKNTSKNSNFKKLLEKNTEKNTEKFNSRIEENENFGNFAVNNLSKITEKDSNSKSKLTTENKSIPQEKLIINNLETELIVKNNEIKTLKKNFKEKIEFLEIENKKNVDKLEDQFENIMGNIGQKHNQNITGMEANSLQMKNEYDELVAKLQSNISNIKHNSVNIFKHESVIEELKSKTNNEIQESKDIYQAKMNELVNYFDKPEYRKLIENINFYIKFKERMNFSIEDVEFLDNVNISDQEYELWMDRIKLNMVTAECDYINSVLELETDYKKDFDKIRLEENRKFQFLENEINDKFEVISLNKFFIKINLFLDVF